MKPTTIIALLLAALTGAGCASTSDSFARSGRGTSTRAPERVLTLSAAALDEMATKGRVAPLAGPARCAVDSYRIIYRTVGGAGEDTTSSAAVLVPRGDAQACQGARPTVMYARGTAFVKDTDMARLELAVPDAVVAATLFAAQGYIVVAPNYVGYAASSADYHPYYNLESQSQDVIDALRAARFAASQMAMLSNGKLFLVGYSQGGAVALATQRALERSGAPAELRVTATAASAGAYMIGDAAKAVFDGQPSIGVTGFLPLLITSYQRSGEGIYASLSDVYASPFDVQTDHRLIPGALTFQQLIAQGKLPLHVFDRGDGSPYLITSRFRQAFNSNPDHPLRQAFAKNHLDAWKPAAPVLLCHGSKDALATIDNTDTVYRSFTSQGSSVVRMDLEDATTPGAGAFQAALDAASKSVPRAAVYHFVGMPFCQANARGFFAQH